MCSILLLSIALLASPGCTSDKNSQFDPRDGGLSLREECFTSTDACWSECEQRKASIDCGSCCRHQDSLCTTKQRHSFEACKRVP